jgi:hypothetical protein
MDFLNKIKAAFLGDNTAGDAIRPSASDYVEWLPTYMLRKSQTELRIDTARPLPQGVGAPGLPDPESVINCLKVLCGLNPFRLINETDGQFVRMHANHRLLFKTRFKDLEDRSVCTITLSIRA